MLHERIASPSTILAKEWVRKSEEFEHDERLQAAILIHRGNQYFFEVVNQLPGDTGFVLTENDSNFVTISTHNEGFWPGRELGWWCSEAQLAIVKGTIRQLPPHHDIKCAYIIVRDPEPIVARTQVAFAVEPNERVKVIFLGGQPGSEAMNMLERFSKLSPLEKTRAVTKLAIIYQQALAARAATPTTSQPQPSVGHIS